MNDRDKTKEQLISELEDLRQRLAALDDIVSQRRRAEDELAKNRAVLRATIDSLPFNFFAIGLDGRYMLQNAESKAQLRADAVGRLPEEVCPNQEDLSLWLDNNRRAFAGEKVEGEVSLSLTGEKRFYYTVVAPIRDGEQLYGILGVNIDITERKLAEEALRQSEERFRLLVEAIPFGAWMCDAQGRNTYISPAFLDSLGMTAEQVREFGWTNALAPEDLGEPLERWRHCVRTGDAWKGEWHFRMKDGTYRTSSPKAAPCAIRRARSPVGSESTSTLPTASVPRKRSWKWNVACSMPRNSKASASWPVESPTISTTSWPESWATPILPWYACQPPSPYARHRDNQEIRAAGCGPDATDVELFGQGQVHRHTAGPVPSRGRQPEDAGHAGVEEGPGDLQPGFQLAGCPCRRRPNGQVVMNLVINASEALGEQGGVIAVTTEALSREAKDRIGIELGQDLPEGLYVCLAVADTGRGMDKQTLAKIFDPFFTTKFTGRGLGLAAVFGIVRGHKGAIQVSSQPGKGTTFG